MKGLAERDSEIESLLGNPHQHDVEKKFKIGEYEFKDLNRKFRKGQKSEEDAPLEYIYYKYLLTSYGSFKQGDTDDYKQFFEDYIAPLKSPYGSRMGEKTRENMLQPKIDDVAKHDDSFDEHIKEACGNKNNTVPSGTHQEAAELWVKYLIDRGIPESLYKDPD